MKSFAKRVFEINRSMGTNNSDSVDRLIKEECINEGFFVMKPKEKPNLYEEKEIEEYYNDGAD